MQRPGRTENGQDKGGRGDVSAGNNISLKNLFKVMISEAFVICESCLLSSETLRDQVIESRLGRK